MDVSSGFLHHLRMATGTDWKRLGDMVVSRRVELGYKTREDFGQQIDLSYRALSDLENGKRSFTAGTYAMVEQALGWFPGSAQAILDGEKPPGPGITQHFKPPREPSEKAQQRPVPVNADPLLALFSSVQNIDWIVHNSPDTTFPEGLTEVVEAAAYWSHEVLASAIGGYSGGRDLRRDLEQLNPRGRPVFLERPPASAEQADPAVVQKDRSAVTAPAPDSGVDIPHPAVTLTVDFESRRNQQAAEAAGQWPAADPAELHRGPHADNAEDQTPEPDRRLAARRGESEEKRRRRLAVEPEDESQDHGRDDLE